MGLLSKNSNIYNFKCSLEMSRTYLVEKAITIKMCNVIFNMSPKEIILNDTRAPENPQGF